jgi:hypothetical protein
MILYLQEFIQQKFNSHLSVLKKVNAIYYQTPASGSFPYIYVGEFNSKNISTKDIEIAEIHWKLTIYLRDKSLKSMLTLAQDIRKILDIKSEERVILIKCLEEKVSLKNDGITQQIIMNFKTIIIGE